MIERENIIPFLVFCVAMPLSFIALTFLTFGGYLK